MEYGFDDEVKKDDMQEDVDKVVGIDEARKRRPFAYWTVGGREYRLKLTTAAICSLEEKYKRNLLEVISGGMPPLAMMLTITQAAMKTWEHGIKYTDVQGLFDKYCEEGGTQLSFMTDVLMEIYKVSGFFSESQQTAMDEKLEEVKDMI